MKETRFSAPTIALMVLGTSLSLGINNCVCGQGEPIKKVTGVTADDSVFRKSGPQEPLVISNVAEAKKYFGPDELKKLKTKVDFGKQVLMVFAWRGSGQDKLDYSVLESYPEQLNFIYTRGRTRDLRPHVYYFAVRSNVLWKGKPVGPRSDKLAPKEYILVEVKGKLESNVLAIGAETTGIQVSAKGITWELEFGKNEKLRKKAKSLDEKNVILKGSLELKSGVEIKKRWIVHVTDLEKSPF